MKIRKTAAIIIAAASMGVSLAAPYSAAMPVMPVYAVEESEYNFEEYAAAQIESGNADGVYEGILYKKGKEENGKEYVDIVDADAEMPDVIVPGEIEGLPVRFIELYNVTGNIVLPDTIEVLDGAYFPNAKSIKLPKSLKKIANSTLQNCYNIKSIEIPDTVEEIGDDCLNGCTSLESIEIPGSVKKIGRAFLNGCTSLEKAVFDEGVEDIGSTPFEDCKNLKYVSLPCSLKNIHTEYQELNVETLEIGTKGYSVDEDGYFETDLGWFVLDGFTGPNLKNIIIKEGSEFIPPLKNLSQEVIDNMVIPDSVTAIWVLQGDYESITIPKQIEYIGEVAMSNNPALKEVKFEDGFKGTISGGAFYGSSIEKLDIPEGAIIKGAGGCAGLKEVSVPITMFTLNDEDYMEHEFDKSFEGDIPFGAAFGVHSDLKELEKVTIKNSASDKEYVLYNCGLNNLDALKTVVLPEGITKIGDSAFYDCKSLEEINIPESVTAIGDHAFVNCTSLEKIEIPDGVKEIGESAFGGCTNIKKFNIPEEVSAIGNGAFYDCISLEEINIPEGVTTISTYAFKGDSSLRNIALPKSLTSIEEDAFSESGIEKIDIPEGVSVIGGSAFANCKDLTDVIIRNRECEIGDILGYLVNDIVIHGYKGSTAEKFAEDNGNKFIPLDGDESTVIGDANLDGDVSLADALLILQHVANVQKYEMSEQAELNADVYNRGDGLTAMEALTIQKYDAKLVTTLPESYQK